MAMTTGVHQPTVGDIEPCGTCGHVKDPSKRLHEVACCGLDSHSVWWDRSIYDMTYYVAHRWGDDKTYAAVKSWNPISETDALAWLERVHGGEVARRSYHEGLQVEFDWWED